MNPDIKSAFVNENRMKPESHQLVELLAALKHRQQESNCFQDIEQLCMYSVHRDLVGLLRVFLKVEWILVLLHLTYQNGIMLEKGIFYEQLLPECMLQWRWDIHRQKKWETLFFVMICEVSSCS